MTIFDYNWSAMDWVLVLVAVGTFLYYYGTKNFRRFTKYNIPHKKPLPFIGSMGSAFVKKQESFHEQILDFYNELKGKPYGGFFMFSHPVILINDPELVKTIAVKDFDYFTDHRAFVTEKAEPLWSKGLFSLQGQRWREMRSKLSPTFTSSKMKTMFALVLECCKQVVSFLEEFQQAPQPGCNITIENNLLVLDLKDFFTRYTNDVIATTAFGVGVDSLRQPTNEFFQMGQATRNIKPTRFVGYFAFPNIMKLLRIGFIPQNVTEFFKSLVVDAMVTREEKGIVRPDMLQLLMEAKKNAEKSEDLTDNKGTVVKMDDEDIVAQALLFFMAGFDTASTLLCFTCYAVAMNPDIQARLQEEIDETLQESAGNFTYEAINSMKYLDMVISETLRMFPPAASTDRVCTRQYTLKTDPPLEIFPGDNLFFPVYGFHCDPKYFPEPEKFDPERFSDENKHKINPLTYIPFGIGPRVCIGNRFVLMETKLALASILSKFNMKVIDKTPKQVKFTQKALNLSIVGGFWVGMESRCS